MGERGPHFHQRPHPPGHVTTFPESADTDGEVATTSRLRPARPQAQKRARAVAMWRSPCCVGLAAKIPTEAREGMARVTRSRLLGASAVRVDARTSSHSARVSIADEPKEPRMAQRLGLSGLTTVINSVAVY